jgi:ATP-dependent Lon protease
MPETMPETPQTPPIPSELPVVPIRGAVVLPMTVAPLGVSRPLSVEAVNRALAGDRTILLVLQTTEADDPTVSDLYKVGTVAILRQMAKSPNGMRVLVEGIARARIDNIAMDQGVMQANRWIAHCRSPPASPPTSRRWSRASTIPCASRTCWPASST